MPTFPAFLVARGGHVTSSNQSIISRTVMGGFLNEKEHPLFLPFIFLLAMLGGEYISSCSSHFVIDRPKNEQRRL